MFEEAAAKPLFWLCYEHGQKAFHRYDSVDDAVVGVEVGAMTIIRGDKIRTGVTAVLPHSGNLYRQKVPAGIFVGNGFGKLTGVTQVDEMGDLETPVLLTSTTSVPRVADALVRGRWRRGNGDRGLWLERRHRHCIAPPAR